MSPRAYVIVNADDFGYSHGVNRGIVEAHERGVVTSTSLMVNVPATFEAVELARQHPRLAIGMHVNFTNEADGWFDVKNPELVRAELHTQYRRFLDLMGRKPTHMDGHQHVQRHETRSPAFLELCRAEGIPLRDQPPVIFKGGFYAQWEYGVTEPDKVSYEQLERMLTNEFTAGIYELACHPGYYDPSFACVYHRDRELELATLTDPRVPALFERLDLCRISYADLPEVAQRLHAA